MIIPHSNEETPIEKIKAYHSIKAFLSNKEQKYIKQILDFREEDNERLTGLDAEDELKYILYMLNCCKSITAFDEGLPRLMKNSCPDLFIELNNGNKILIEVKCKDKVNIAKNEWNRLKAFSNQINLPLYVAVKQNNLWALYDSNYFEKNDRKIKFEKDFKNSVFPQIFDSSIYNIPKGLKFKSFYNKNKKKGIGFKDIEGKLEKFEIYLNEKCIYVSEIDEDSNYDKKSFLCEALIEIAANDEQNIIKQDANITVVEDKINKHTKLIFYLFIYIPVFHTINSFSEIYTISQFLKDRYCKKDNYCELRKKIEDNIHWLQSKGYNIKPID